ncbi:DUF4238 domain-containing protein [Kitasatospora sp. NPDC048407]|uniref:DUF4238 domain-containing protein n=1 Tax=Kitasatospora sp. NPDC048407 TaxID=3364051 RepID=UPI00371F0064
MPPHPKKHHFVPQFLLERFAGPEGKLVVNQYMNERQFTSAVVNVGHRNYGHSLYWPGREPDHSSMEAAMASIEGEAAVAVKELARSRQRDVPHDIRRPLAWLLALQYQRSRFLMHLLSERVRSKDNGLAADEIQTGLLTLILAYVIHPWRLRDDDDAPFKDRWNALVAFLLAGADMHWTCYRPRNGGLVVGDNLVCFSGIVGEPPLYIPPKFFDHGVQVGLENFRRLTVPLGDDLALIISRDARDRARLDAAAINRFTVFNSREFIAHAPDWPDRHPDLALDLRSSLRTQRLVAPAFLQNYGSDGR